MAVHRPRTRASSGHSALSVELTGGGQQLHDLAQRLKDADKELRKELQAGLTRATKPLMAAVRVEIEPTMPKGYEDVLSRSLAMRTQVRTGATAGVRITAIAKGTAKNRDIRALDRGTLRHPVYGRRRRNSKGWLIPNPWVRQTIRSGFWTRPMKEGAPEVRKELVAVIAAVSRKIARG